MGNTRRHFFGRSDAVFFVLMYVYLAKVWLSRKFIVNHSVLHAILQPAYVWRNRGSSSSACFTSDFFMGRSVMFLHSEISKSLIGLDVKC